MKLIWEVLICINALFLHDFPSCNLSHLMHIVVENYNLCCSTFIYNAHNDFEPLHKKNVSSFLICMFGCSNLITNFQKMFFLPAWNRICFSMSFAKPQLIFVSWIHSTFPCYWWHFCVAFFAASINPTILIFDAMHSSINNTTCFLHFYILIL